MLGNLFAFVSSIVLIKLKWIHRHSFCAGLFLFENVVSRIGKEESPFVCVCDNLSRVT